MLLKDVQTYDSDVLHLFVNFNQNFLVVPTFVQRRKLVCRQDFSHSLFMNYKGFFFYRMVCAMGSEMLGHDRLRYESYVVIRLRGYEFKGLKGYEFKGLWDSIY